MTEDYLWDKTGGDIQIEQLENALKAFRYQETAPPALPAKIIPFESKSPRRFFRLAFAFASLAAILVVCLGFWLRFPIEKTEISKDSSEVVLPPIIEKSGKEVLTEKQPDSTFETIEMPRKSVERKTVKVKKIVLQVVRENKSAAQKVEIKEPNEFTVRNIEIKKPPVKLTKEETYAYNQLMLALSITSSKLRIVSDKLEGVEEKNAVRVNER